VHLFLTPIVVLSLFALYFVYIGHVVPIFILTAIIFATHFSYDEFFLKGEQVSRWRALTLASFLGIDFFLSVGLVVPAYSQYLFASALALLVLMGVRILVGKENVSGAEKYLAFVGALLFLLAGLGSADIMLGAIVLLHCYNWYDWGHARAVEKKAVFPYWRDVGLTLSVFVAVFVLVRAELVPSLASLFSLNEYFYYYYPLAVAHIATSVRFGMLRG